MGNRCSRCCGKIQDWCRDSCGCCCCSCCKTTNVEWTVETVEDKVIKKKDIPYGYGRIFAGVRKPNQSYTSPILEIHTWRKEMMQTNLNNTTLSQRVALGGIQTARDNADHHVGPVREIEHRKIELDEEIQCIPIESIISIKYSGEIKKELKEQVHTRLKTPPPQPHRSCCTKLHQWCSATFCCCCNDSRNQVHADSGRTIAQIIDEKGGRVILITIEYIRYNNIKTPTYFNALPTADAAVFFKERFHTDTLKFYLLNNQDFDQTNFDLKRAQGASLCLLVTHLKAMADEYPDESTLENIISQQEIQVIGDPPQENFNQLIGPKAMTTRVPVHTTEN